MGSSIELARKSSRFEFNTFRCNSAGCSPPERAAWRSCDGYENPDLRPDHELPRPRVRREAGTPGL